MDAIVVALGAVSNNLLGDEIKSIVLEVHVVGDVLKPGKALNAIFEGFKIGRKV